VTQTVLSDDARESLLREQDIARQRGVVATGLGEAQKEAATISAAKTAEWAEYQKNWAIQQQRAQEAQQVQLARMEKDMQSQQAQYEKAAKEIDPSRLISGPKSWIAALAMGLGAYGSALARTPNYAQQIINQALERDMDAQKIGLQAKKDKMSMTQQILVDMRSRFQSDIAAREATKGAMFGVFASQQEARAQALKGTEAEARSKESALQLAAESQAATSRAFQLESKQVSENNTTGIAQTEGRENSASHTVGTQSQQTHGTTTSTQTGSSYSPASAGVAPVDLVADLNQRTGALAGVAKVAGGPRKTDETKMGTAEEHIRGLIGLQASGRELMRLNAATNFLERKIPWTKLSTEQKVAYQNYKSDERLANTGKGINTAEIAEEYDKFLGSNLTSEGLNAAVRQDMVNGRFKIGSQIATLHPQLKKELVERMRSSGALSDRDMDEILTLRSNEPEAVKGTRLGLTDLNATPARTDKPTPVRDFLNNTLGSYR
jgi:hypothetical protein